MKYITLFIALGIISIGLSAYRIAPETNHNHEHNVEGEKAETKGIQFFKGTFKEALAEAKAQNKPVFIDVYAVWCGPCKWMAKNTFTNKDAAKYYNENFINYKIDAERGEGPYVARKYGIRGYPTLLYLDGEGKVLHKVAGAHPANSFVEVGEKVIAKK
ncbi:MAG: thioredoxin family protein [Bacteroidia bacterium]